MSSFMVQRLLFSWSKTHQQHSDTIKWTFISCDFRVDASYNKLPNQQLVNGLSNLCLGLHLQLVVLSPGSLCYSQLQLRLVTKTYGWKKSSKNAMSQSLSWVCGTF